jgi:hypothetical protein
MKRPEVLRTCRLVLGTGRAGTVPATPLISHGQISTKLFTKLLTILSFLRGPDSVRLFLVSFSARTGALSRPTLLDEILNAAFSKVRDNPCCVLKGTQQSILQKMVEMRA